MKKILFLIFLFYSIFSIFMHNNYSTITNVCISSQIANPIFNVNFDAPAKIDNSNPSIKYSFKINNFNNETISDIPFNYCIALENLPSEFTYQVFLDNTEISNLNSFLLNNSKKEEHIFTININYIGNFNTQINSVLKLKINYSFSNFSSIKEYNFLNINITPNIVTPDTVKPSHRITKSSSKKSKNENHNFYSTPKPQNSDINSDVFIDTNTNIQIQISK